MSVVKCFYVKMSSLVIMRIKNLLLFTPSPKKNIEKLKIEGGKESKTVEMTPTYHFFVYFSFIYFISLSLAVFDLILYNFI